MLTLGHRSNTFRTVKATLMMLALVTISLFINDMAFASVDVHHFKSPENEARYQALVGELRCPKCQNTNLAGSGAGLADDLKQRVYQMVEAGQSDAQIRDYMVQRYGDFITYKPPMRAGTWLLWWGPLVLLLSAGLMIIVRARRQPSARKPALSPAEHERLQRLLKGQTDTDASL
jgi:cytochrome c-type biogenesis protein CcmH